MAANPRCEFPGCTNGATARCGKCSRVYCVKHHTVYGGGYSPISYECDQCAEERKRRAEASDRWVGPAFKRMTAGGAILGFLVGIIYPTIPSVHIDLLSSMIIYTLVGGFVGFFVFLFIWGAWLSCGVRD